MGLSSSNLHIRDVQRDDLLPALDRILLDAGFEQTRSASIPAGGPFAMRGHRTAVAAGPFYVVSPLRGNWLTIIEAHGFVSGAPGLSEVGKRISKDLACYCLTLSVHDDEILNFHLEHKGKSLDRYTSCPQYGEFRRLTDAQIESQRHAPAALRPLLPEGGSPDELQSLLIRGWWDAYDSGRLNRFGEIGDDEDFVMEGERMTALGTLLKLHGAEGQYPFAAWGEAQGIDWPEFVAVRYKRVPAKKHK